MPPSLHYTQEPSRLCATSDASYTRVRGGGFVTREMLEQALDDLRRTPQTQRPGAMLVDLREVAGYEASCLRPAQQFLHEAVSLGVSRIALVAPSSVMRTASQVAAHPLPVELRTFEHEPSAQRWLAPRGTTCSVTCSPRC
ncbi:MAG: STAS/SEC14 domain-containing protein [Myxococcota bacterium]